MWFERRYWNGCGYETWEKHEKHHDNFAQFFQIKNDMPIPENANSREKRKMFLLWPKREWLFNFERILVKPYDLCAGWHFGIGCGMLPTTNQNIIYVNDDEFLNDWRSISRRRKFRIVILQKNNHNVIFGIQE